ncbi:MAG: hypothetical protein JW774_09890 [Candidatus Aureabacteria bacterium]|nr:hypothetical protein [Candidatus Auribacterota bacterium]
MAVDSALAPKNNNLTAVTIMELGPRVDAKTPLAMKWQTVKQKILRGDQEFHGDEFLKNLFTDKYAGIIHTINQDPEKHLLTINALDFMMNTYNWVTLEYINEPLLVQEGANEDEEKEKAIQEMRVMFDAIISAVARTCDRLASGDLTAGSVQLRTSEDKTVTPVSNARDASGNKRNAKVVILPVKFDPLTMAHIRLIFESFAQGADCVVTMMDEYDERKAGLSGRTIREADTKWLYDALNGFLVEPAFQCERRSLLDCDGEAILPTLIYENRAIAEDVTWIYLAGYDHFNWIRTVPDALMSMHEFDVQMAKYAVDPREMHELLKTNKMVNNFYKFQRNLADLPEVERRALIATIEKRWPEQASNIIPLLNGLVHYLREMDTPSKLAHTRQLMLSLNINTSIGGFIVKRLADARDKTDDLIRERHKAIEALCKIAEIDYYEQTINDWLDMTHLPAPIRDHLAVFRERLTRWISDKKEHEINYDGNGSPHEPETIEKIKTWLGYYQTAQNPRLATNVRVTNWHKRYEQAAQWKERGPAGTERHILSDLFDQLLGLTEVDGFDQFFEGLDKIYSQSNGMSFTIAKSPSKNPSSRLRIDDTGHSMPYIGFQHATSLALHRPYSDDYITKKDREIAAQVIGSLIDLNLFKHPGMATVNRAQINPERLTEILGKVLIYSLDMDMLLSTILKRAKDSLAVKERSPLMTRDSTRALMAYSDIAHMMHSAYGRGLSAIDIFLSTCFKNDNSYTALRHTIAQGVHDDAAAMKLVRKKITAFRDLVRQRCETIFAESEGNPHPMSSAKRRFILEQITGGTMLTEHSLVRASS